MKAHRLVATVSVLLTVGALHVIVGFLVVSGRGTAKIELSERSLPQPNPDAQARVESHIDMLRKESITDSLSALSGADLFFWPGPIGGGVAAFTYQFPLSSEFGELDVERIMSNRRVLKLHRDLSALRKAEAARLVNEEVRRELGTYQQLLDVWIAEQSRYFAANVAVQGGPSFEVGNTGGRPTIVGSRLKLLSLAFLAGNLELDESAAVVVDLSERAVRQYREYSQRDDLHLVFRHDFLRMAGLYSRQPLAVGLVGTNSRRPNPLVEQFRRRFLTRELPFFDARATPYDHNAILQSGLLIYPANPIVFHYFGELSDADFEAIINSIRSTR